MAFASFSELARFAIRKQPCRTLVYLLTGEKPRPAVLGVSPSRRSERGWDYFFGALRRLRRRAGRSAGTSPITSAVQIEVTNFFTPWLSKSIVVRSVFDSVTTPIPYCS